MKDSIVVNGVVVDKELIEMFAYKDIAHMWKQDPQREINDDFWECVEAQMRYYYRHPEIIIESVIDHANGQLDYKSLFAPALRFNREKPCQSLRKYYRQWCAGSFPAIAYNRDLAEYPEDGLWVKVTPLQGRYQGKFMIQGFYRNLEVFNHLE